MLRDVDNHVYQDIMVDTYDVSRLKRDGDVHLGEAGTGIVTRTNDIYRERMYSEEGLHLELGYFKKNCSGGLCIESFPRRKSWELTPWFGGCEVCHIRYGLDGNLQYAIIGVDNPGPPRELGQLDGDGVGLMEEPKKMDFTRLTLTPSCGELGRVYTPDFYGPGGVFDGSIPLSSECWFRDEAVRVEHEGRVLVVDWTNPKFIEMLASLSGNITKYAKFPKKIDTGEIWVVPNHLDEVIFPDEEMVWQVWWGDVLGGRHDFTDQF